MDEGNPKIKTAEIQSPTVLTLGSIGATSITKNNKTTNDFQLRSFIFFIINKLKPLKYHYFAMRVFYSQTFLEFCLFSTLLHNRDNMDKG